MRTSISYPLFTSKTLASLVSVQSNDIESHTWTALIATVSTLRKGQMLSFSGGPRRHWVEIETIKIHSTKDLLFEPRKIHMHSCYSTIFVICIYFIRCVKHWIVPQIRTQDMKYPKKYITAETMAETNEKLLNNSGHSNSSFTRWIHKQIKIKDTILFKKIDNCNSIE